MSDGTRNTIASTIFRPGPTQFGPVPKPAYMNNVYGSVDKDVPDHVGTGRYVIRMPNDVDEFRTSISHHATNDFGFTRSVSVKIARNSPTPDVTILDIFIRDDFGNLTDDFVRCEVSLAQLPL